MRHTEDDCKLKIACPEFSRRRNRKLERSREGFTLVEMLVVVSIIAILTVAGALSYSSVLKRSRDAKRKADIEQIRSALEIYRTDMGAYPSGNGDADVLATPLQSYMARVPQDPLVAKQPYQYQATNAVNGKYYGYCVSAQLEQTSIIDSTCGNQGFPGGSYNYGRKNP